ncbi:MAG: PQQ-binding-like beta-propeller repeat protein [Candidatus Hydrogenedentes bacterium]|nr:PQQ-binding-like beta-propeller repeat protein [Candidatus Hydrogenedentota bacterium]
MIGKQLAAAVVFLVVLVFSAAAEDWPTYQHDTYRSGTTTDSFQLPLHEIWRYSSLQPPQPAWPDPAVQDFAAKPVRIHRPRATYDRAFHTSIAGGLVFFGSSADDRVVALDADTGAERWSFVTGAPVRLSPAVVNGRIYAGSDDGYVYCLDAADGGLIWKYSPEPDERRIPGNGRIISACPVRTGIVVKGGVVYFGAGMFPEEGVYLCALDAASGREIWKVSPDPMDFIRRFSSEKADRRFALSPQGCLLASDRNLYIPTGRTSPVAVNFSTGEIEGMLECPGGEGGTYALLTPDTIISGPGTRLSAFDAGTQERVATFPGRCILVQGETSYLLSDDWIAALDRAKYRENATRQNELRSQRRRLRDAIKIMAETERAAATQELAGVEQAMKELRGSEYTWRKPCPESYAMILAGGLLIVGSEDEVRAIRISDGETEWSSPVDGNAYGLAAANGRLLVSTDTGAIHCFAAGPDRASTPPAHRAVPEGGAEVTAAASFIIKTAGVRQGYCLDLGCQTGGVGLEIARNSGLKVVAVDDEQAVSRVRAKLIGTGLYGARFAAIAGALENLPFTDYIADVIVSERALPNGCPPFPPNEAARLLRPHTGVLFLKCTPETAAAVKAWAGKVAGCSVAVDDGSWLVLRRGGLDGAGEWTHQYADAGNSGCSGDTIVSAPARLQWFGLPGPRPMVDRHHRAMPPLVKNGRMFVPGDNCIIAVDAYNGTPLWELETPDNRRLANPRDSGQMVAADDLLYVAVHDECWVLDAASGERVATYQAPQLAGDEKRNWGYIAVIGDFLLGSGQKPDASYTTMNTLGDFEIQWGDFKRLLTSDYLFCMDRRTGRVVWTRGGGLFIHPAIAAVAGRLYFIESHSRTAARDLNGRSTLEVLWDNSPTMLAVDLTTGKPAWEIPVDFSLCQHIIYLSYASDTLVVTGSGNREGRAWYYLYGFDAATGTPMWQANHPNNKRGIGGDHGEQIHHPVIVGDVVYAEPVAYALRTGARVGPSGAKSEWAMEKREGCGTVSASARCLFYRDGHPCVQNLLPESPRTKLNYVTRPGCWINVIPAGGLILIPEASSGCSCPYPLQTSLAYIPE